jgi:excisionase family DNA binding protein
VTPDTPASAPRVMLTVEEAARRLSIGRTNMFALLKTGAIESVKVGRLRRVPDDAINTYITLLLDEQHSAVTKKASS